MQERLKFWWKALRLGTIQLNTTAGWVGTIIIVLGIAGIVVPVVFHLSLWLIAVVLLALLAVIMAEGGYQVWQAANQKRLAAESGRDEARDELARRFDAQRHALVFGGIGSRTEPAPNYATGTVELRLPLINKSGDPLRFEIESMSVTIDGRESAENPPLLNRGDVIAPDDSVLYLAPTVTGVRIPWQHGGLEVAVRYGPPSGPFRFRTSRRWHLRQYRVPDAPAGQRDQVWADLLGEPVVEEV